MWTTRSIKYASIEQCFGKIRREKEAKFFNGMNPFTFSKLKSKEYVKKLLVQKVSNLMQALFTVKGKVKKIGRCPVNQLKLFAVQ